MVVLKRKNLLNKLYTCPFAQCSIRLDNQTQVAAAANIGSIAYL